MTRRPARADLLALGALLVLALAVAVDGWRSPTRWMPDSYFYRAQVLQLQGVDKEESLARAFSTPRSAEERRAEQSLPVYQRKLSNPDWVEGSAQFYERRWLVPAIAAALDPWLGEDGLEAASLAGYVAIVPFLFLLLRLWFRPLVAGLAAGTVLLVEPLRMWSETPLTDSWGVALESAAVAAACLVLMRGPRWLAAWIPAVLLLGFTRDAAAFVVGATVVVLLVRRDRTTVWLVGTGIAAALPPLLLFGAPLVEAIAYPLTGYYPAPDADWGFVADRYWPGLKTLVREDLGYLADHPVSAAILVGGMLSLALLPRTEDRRHVYVWAAAVGSLLYLLVSPGYQELRLELVVVPFVALGLASIAARLAEGSSRARVAPMTRA
jgi:hypothetical protein